MASAHNVCRDSVASGLAGLCEPCGGVSVCALGWQEAAHRSAMAPYGLWHTGRNRAYVSVGRCGAGPGAWKLQLYPLGSDFRTSLPSGGERLYRRRPPGQWLGMDFDTIPTAAGFQSVSLLSGIL